MSASSQLIAVLPRFLLKLLVRPALSQYCVFRIEREWNLWRTANSGCHGVSNSENIAGLSNDLWQFHQNANSAYFGETLFGVMDLSVKEMRSTSNPMAIEVPKKSIELDNFGFVTSSLEIAIGSASLDLKGISLSIPVGKITALVG